MAFERNDEVRYLCCMKRKVPPQKRTASASVPYERIFAKELAGETPPSFEAMQRLYGLAFDLYGFHPWRVLDEDNLIVVRDPVSGEFLYCSVMGALGEVLSMHAYIGTEGLRQFRQIAAGVSDDPAKFLASTHCVYVEFVKRAELLRQDRELLAALGHPQGRGLASPIFRTIRPGYLPWFVTEDETRTLTECIRAVVAFCDAMASEEKPTFWGSADTFPMVTLRDAGEPGCHIEMFHAVLPPEPPALAANLPEETLLALRGKDFVVGGVMELDLIYSIAAIGKKGERSACAAIAIAVDAKSGMVFPPEVSVSSIPPGDILAAVFVKAIRSTGTIPSEVRVRDKRFVHSLAPLMESCGVVVRLAKRLPAADEARSSLLSFFG